MCIAYAVVGSCTWIAERKECNTFINTIINAYLQYVSLSCQNVSYLLIFTKLILCDLV